MVEVIAEAGVTHLGSLKVALELADIAKEAGAKVVKYQTFITEKTIRKHDQDFNKIKNLELSKEDFITLAKHCEKIGIEFLSTPDELDSLKFLVERLGVKRIKIGSADLLNKPLVEAAYRTGKPVILSTGMATLDEIKSVLPYDNGFVSITLLHCVSLYPTPLEHANIRAIKTLQTLGYPTGLSDHTVGSIAAILAMTLGASVIEKHFCPNGYGGIDKEVSMIPVELKRFISDLDFYEKVLGTGIKAPEKLEQSIIHKIRKGPDGLRGLDANS